MRAVVQRVLSSKVTVSGEIVGEIEKGFNVLLGIQKEDTEDDIKYLVDKIINLRVFTDDNDKMNLSLLDVKGELLIVSQFTLYGDCRRGRRPSFIEALGGEEAERLYEIFLEKCRECGLKVEKGIFGADMKVSIENDGPVTLLLESKKTF
ncbi:D-aminoacyl-tRNA deacylase [Clostridium hydrogeniformans]|uniref:D-aminoacyl-tRNA deacylase n=1 Tax=Clostridium hydrogeniformans TaxID=349933 RepID=UPI000482B954|nr:D-aminoacyl-tRNA deacylase [Clostridium hydrogeniformans]